MKSTDELRDESAKRYVFSDKNAVQFHMDFSTWQHVPSDRIFYQDKEGPREGWVTLIADGYGARNDYGNGSIFVRASDLPEPSP